MSLPYAALLRWQNLVLPAAFISLGYAFWLQPQSKEIAAGVAIFLFGMLAMEQGFKVFNGGLFERMLRSATQGMPRSIGFGVVTTTIMQSSSLVSVLTISFLSAGLIELASGIGVIFGANLGTTTGAWLIAGLGLKVKLSAYSMPMLVFGVILVFQKSQLLKSLGYVLAGVGFLFLGIHYLKEGFESVKAAIDLSAYAVGGWQGLLLYTLIGVIATVVMQSSHATLVLTITALAAQQLSYENSLAVAIGSNLGTTISAILGSIGANVEGRRLAAAHVIFNGVTGGVALLCIVPMMYTVDLIASGMGIAAVDYTLKLAIFHSLFNILGLCLMVPWTSRLVNLLTTRIKPTRVTTEQPKYLSTAAMELPETAVTALRQESARLYDRAIGIIAHGLGIPRRKALSGEDLDLLISTMRRPIAGSIEERYTQSIKGLYSAIVDYSCQVPADGHPEILENVHSLRHACRDVVEALKALKHLQKNMLVHMGSHNPQVRSQYDVLRLQILTVIRAVEEMRKHEEDAVTTLSFDAVKVSLKQADIVSDETLDQLIRAHNIDALIAASLMKDANYTRTLCGKLLDAASVIFGPVTIAAQQLEDQLSLTDDEIEQLARQQTEDMIHEDA